MTKNLKDNLKKKSNIYDKRIEIKYLQATIW